MFWNPTTSLVSIIYKRKHIEVRHPEHITKVLATLDYEVFNIMIISAFTTLSNAGLSFGFSYGFILFVTLQYSMENLVQGWVLNYGYCNSNFPLTMVDWMERIKCGPYPVVLISPPSDAMYRTENDLFRINISLILSTFSWWFFELDCYQGPWVCNTSSPFHSISALAST